MTGAGWGGCIVALVPQSDLENYIDGIKKDYYATLNSIQAKEDCLDNVIFPTQPGSGAQIYTVWILSYVNGCYSVWFYYRILLHYHILK